MWLLTMLLLNSVDFSIAECPSSCPAGFGYSSLINCTAAITSTTDDDDDGTSTSTPPSCEPCIPGSTFSTSASDHRLPCRQCSRCPARSHVINPCNATSDVECGCGRSNFYDARLSRCRRCSPCPHGFGATRPCSSHADTECSPCAPGITYSRVVSAAEGCTLCSECTAGNHRVVQTCTSIQDTVCSTDKEDAHRIKSLLASPASSSPEDGHSSGLGVMPLYCGLTVAIVLLLLAVIRHWLNAANNANVSRTEPADVKVEMMSSKTKRDLEVLLDVRRADWRDWRGVALELGYSSFKIAQLQYKGKQSGGPTHHLLKDLCKQDTVTVHQLLKVFNHLGRIDAVRLLQPLLLERPHKNYTPEVMV